MKSNSKIEQCLKDYRFGVNGRTAFRQKRTQEVIYVLPISPIQGKSMTILGGERKVTSKIVDR